MTSNLDTITGEVVSACYNTGVLNDARLAVADTLSVAGAAYRLHPLRPPYKKSLTGEGVILGSWEHTDPYTAVAINAFLAHSLELDDWLPQGFIHGGCVIVPAALSTALELDADLKLFLQGVAAGYQAGYMIGGYLGKQHYGTWHTTATAGIVGAAVASGVIRYGCMERVIRLLVLSALNYAGGLWIVPKMDPRLKPLSAMHASASGYILSSIGSFGLELEDRIEEMCRILRGDCGKMPRDHALELNGYKFYPSCRHTHTAIEAALEAGGKINGNVNKVKRVVIETYDDAIKIASRGKFPSTVEEGRFNISYLVSVALVYGDVWLDTIPRGLTDPVVREVFGRVKVVENPEFTMDYPDSMPSRVIVETTEGDIGVTVRWPLGSPERGVDSSHVLGKALKLAEFSADSSIHSLAHAVLEKSWDNPVRELIPQASHCTP
ncbi:MAG: MmgE/PrpD family protein [Desulfurococcales archaeon]|nr:MmgE/PrpD family protein [Desulfurococcales archaeon]